MRLRALPLLLCLASAPALAEPATGHWLVAADFFGSPRYFIMNVTDKGGTLTGDFDGDTLTGTLAGGAITFHGADPKGGFEDAKATLDASGLHGEIAFVWSGAKDRTPEKATFTATRIVEHVGPPQRHEFTPTAFHREFSAKIPPVLHIGPRDTVHTWTVDAGGFDATGVRRSGGGNPQTGPFYVDGAMPGDTLAIHIDKLRLNRDYAISTNGIVPRALDSDHAQDYPDAKVGEARWKLDRVKGLASPAEPGEHLKSYAVPVRPMLGCVAVARQGAAPPTGDSGEFGGNMDFNEIREGATVMLPVENPGALLYVGDAHALQGDGETTGDALETSMDVTFTVEVIAKHGMPDPRVENATHLIALGYAGSLDEAVRAATTNMSKWLTERYGLTAPEIAEVLGSVAEYKITEVADRNAGIALSIARSALKTLPAK
ncbi:MAG TPA: acetamidase/formamidase family protein [Kofleriaceae bacterium]|jgi:acetamidase/formamidase